MEYEINDLNILRIESWNILFSTNSNARLIIIIIISSSSSSSSISIIIIIITIIIYISILLLIVVVVVVGGVVVVLVVVVVVHILVFKNDLRVRKRLVASIQTKERRNKQRREDERMARVISLSNSPRIYSYGFESIQ